MIEWLNENYQAVSAILAGISGMLVALFTGGVWLLQKRTFSVANEAKVKVAASYGHIDKATSTASVEVLLINANQPPAVIQSWSIILQDGHNQEDMSRSKTVKSVHVKAPGNVQGIGWALKRESPLALAVEHQVTNSGISSGAKAKVTVGYTGGAKETQYVEHELKMV